MLGKATLAVFQQNVRIDGDVAVATLLGILTLPFVAGFFLLGNLIAVAMSGSGDDLRGGAGSALAAFAMKPIPLPGRDSSNQGTEFVPSYSRAEATSGTLSFGGCWKIHLRIPIATIIGPTALVVRDGSGAVSADYSVLFTGTRGTVRIQWSANHSSQVRSPRSRFTRITFPLLDAAEGDVVERTVTVSFDDDDGSIPSATALVRIRVVATDLPPVCRQKPYLPQCQPE